MQNKSHTLQNIALDEMCRKFWNNQRAWCQTSLIKYLFSENTPGFHLSNIDHIYYTNEDGEEGEQDILEWWHVNSYIAGLLSEQWEPILKNNYGIWWGRCKNSPNVYVDEVIEDIVRGVYKIDPKVERRP